MKYVPPDVPWKVRDENLPMSADTATQLRFILNYAVMGPSIYNTQPWLFKVTGSEIAMYLDRGRVLPVADPLGRNLVMSCGAALYHLRIAIGHFGYKSVVRVFPDLDVPNLLAFIRLGDRKVPSEEEERHFMAIQKRRTVRTELRSDAIPQSTIQRLLEGAELEGAYLYPINDSSEQQIVTDLVHKAYAIRESDASFIQEIERWTRSGWDDHPIADTSYTSRAPGAPVPPEARMLRGLDQRQILFTIDKIEPGEPPFLILATNGDKMASWLTAGQALGRVLLTAADDDLNAAFLSLPIGIDHLRERLHSLIGGDRYPQLILRIGRGVPGTPTRRLPVDRVTPEN